MSTFWLTRSLSTAARRGSMPTVKVLFARPMNRWSYSTPNDQFGVKPYSKPTPTVPPQRVELVEAHKPLTVSQRLKRLPVTAAPPLKYGRAEFQAQPSCAVIRPMLSTLAFSVNAGNNALKRVRLRLAQSP